MRIIICTGIYPPAVGGPATHARDLREELTARGHSATVLTLADSGPDRRPECASFRRGWPWPLRFLAIVVWLLRNRRRYDVVYATGLHAPAVLAARLARRPVVIKVVGDPAWERARRLKLTPKGFDAFQRGADSLLRVRLMRALRALWSRRATAVTVPSEFLRGVVVGWGVPGERVVTIPNGVRVPRDARFRANGNEPLRIVSVGRLIPHKRLDLILAAVASAPPTTLEIIGEGPEADSIVSLQDHLNLQDRVTVVGSLDHDSVLDRLAAADALVLASEYEGLPHVVVEALACGTPVIAPRVGGVDEVISSEENGLLYEPLTAESIHDAIRRLAEDPAFHRRLSEQAALSTQGLRFERCAERIESLLLGVRQSSEPAPRPAVVMVGKSRAIRRGEPGFESKLRVLTRHLDVTWISAGRLRLTGSAGARLYTIPAPGRAGRALFYCCAPLLALGLALTRRAAIVCQSPFEAASVMALAAALPRSVQPLIVVEGHGHWKTSSRLYGSPVRRLLAPLADRVAVWALRRADRVRVVSRHLQGEARQAGYDGEIDRFMTWTDFRFFLEREPRPLPSHPHAAFIGMLEDPKGVDVLLTAWKELSAQLPGATLTVLGKGSGEGDLREQAAQLGIEGTVRFEASRSSDGVRRLLDESTCLVVPSRSEGLPRVVFEAMARARAVVGTTVGGIPEIVSDGESGVLVPPDDPEALAWALALVLGEDGVAERLGRAGRERTLRIDPLAEWEAGTERLANWLAGRS